jgi:acetolactate synthase I/III small subunit
MWHTLSVLVENKPGVLARVAGLFSARGYNIESLTVGETEDSQISRMTIVVSGEDAVLEQISKQTNKLIDVIGVLDLTGKAHLERELCLIKVKSETQARDEIFQAVNIFRAKVVDVNARTFTVELTGSQEKNNALIELLKPFGIVELVRTGAVAISRGPEKAYVDSEKEKQG